MQISFNSTKPSSNKLVLNQTGVQMQHVSHTLSTPKSNFSNDLKDAPEAFQAQAAAWQAQQGQYNTLMQQAATNLQNQIAACPSY